MLLLSHSLRDCQKLHSQLVAVFVPLDDENKIKRQSKAKSLVVSSSVSQLEQIELLVCLWSQGLFKSRSFLLLFLFLFFLFMYFHLHHIPSLSLSLSLPVSCSVNVCSVHQSGGSSKATWTRTAFLLHPSLTASSSTLLIFFPSLFLYSDFSCNWNIDFHVYAMRVHLSLFLCGPLFLLGRLFPLLVFLFLSWSLGFLLASPLTVLSSVSTCYACLSSASGESGIVQ